MTTWLLTGVMGVMMAQVDVTKIDPKNLPEFDSFYQGYEATYRPLQIDVDEAWWEASTTGEKAAFDRREAAEKKIIDFQSNPNLFAALKAYEKERSKLSKEQQRVLTVLINDCLPRQADKSLQERIIAIEADVERTFNTHRGEMNGKSLTENDVREILLTSKDSDECKAAWMGFVGVGEKVEKRLADVVKLRNQLAKSMGFDNYYVMQLSLQEIDEDHLISIFDELDRLTKPAFVELKNAIDKDRAEHFGIDVKDLRPWHYADIFFQEAPPLGGDDLDSVYKKTDLLKLAHDYYEGMGLEVDDILQRSDLYEREGKSSHAFAVDIDRNGDTRVLCNLKPSLRWMDTLVHELGHAVYDKYISHDLPWVIRTPSHSITTEGYAMMMGAMAKNPEYLTDVVGLSPTDAERYVAAARKSLRAEKLIFSRWAQVMVRFERSMYANPDQDLAKLWWDLKSEYQLMPPPEDQSLPGYAAKIHVVTVPVYYHSYMLGDVFAAQVQQTMASKLFNGKNPRDIAFVNSKKAGEFMREEIFEPGNRYSWRDLTKEITGRDLDPRSFVEHFVK